MPRSRTCPVVSGALTFALTAVALAPVAADDALPPRGVAAWDALAYGHHRAVVHVDAPADAVVAEVPWRRPDAKPEEKDVIVVDAATGLRVADVARLEVTRERGVLAFRPATAPGDYYLYYLPFQMTGRSNYPKVDYPRPVDWADAAWHARQMALARDEAWRRLPVARVVALQSSDALSAFTDMEEVASAEETRALLARHPGAPFLVFAEDRSHAIRMTSDLPRRWAVRDEGAPLAAEARPGEFVSVQVGLYAVDRDLQDVTVATGDARAADGRVLAPASSIHSFTTRGVDWRGRDFARPLAVAKGAVQPLWLGVAVPEAAAAGDYALEVRVSARGLEARAVRLVLNFP